MTIIKGLQDSSKWYKKDSYKQEKVNFFKENLPNKNKI